MPGLRVNTDGIAGPYIIVPSTKTDRLASYLRAHEVLFDITRNAIRANNNDDVINLGTEADSALVQELLDDWEE